MVTKFLDKLVAKNAHREILRRTVYLTPSNSNKSFKSKNHWGGGRGIFENRRPPTRRKKSSYKT